jgi:hypothetical protein
LVVIRFEASSAVTVKLKAVPAVAEAGAVTEKWVAWGVVPPPQAVRRHKPEIEIRSDRDLFMTPPKNAHAVQGAQGRVAEVKPNRDNRWGFRAILHLSRYQL